MASSGCKRSYNEVATVLQHLPNTADVPSSPTGGAFSILAETIDNRVNSRRRARESLRRLSFSVVAKGFATRTVEPNLARERGIAIESFHFGPNLAKTLALSV